MGFRVSGVGIPNIEYRDLTLYLGNMASDFSNFSEKLSAKTKAPKPVQIGEDDDNVVAQKMSSLKRTLKMVMICWIEWKRLEEPLLFDRLSRCPEENSFRLSPRICNEYSIIRQFIKDLGPNGNLDSRQFRTLDRSRDWRNESDGTGTPANSSRDSFSWSRSEILIPNSRRKLQND